MKVGEAADVPITVSDTEDEEDYNTAANVKVTATSGRKRTRSASRSKADEEELARGKRARSNSVEGEKPRSRGSSRGARGRPKKTQIIVETIPEEDEHITSFGDFDGPNLDTNESHEPSGTAAVDEHSSQSQICSQQNVPVKRFVSGILDFSQTSSSSQGAQSATKKARSAASQEANNQRREHPTDIRSQAPSQSLPSRYPLRHRSGTPQISIDHPERGSKKGPTAPRAPLSQRSANESPLTRHSQIPSAQKAVLQYTIVPKPSTPTGSAKSLSPPDAGGSQAASSLSPKQNARGLDSQHAFAESPNGSYSRSQDDYANGDLSPLPPYCSISTQRNMEFVQSILSQLEGAGLDAHRTGFDALAGLPEVIRNVKDRNSALYTTIMNKFLERGLLQRLLNIKLISPFWRYQRDCLEFSRDIEVMSSVLINAGLLLSFTEDSRGDCPPVLLSSIGALLAHERVRMVKSLRELWRRRHQLSHVPTDVRRNLAATVVDYGIVLERAFNRIGVTIIPLFVEFGALLLYYWSQTKKDPAACIVLLLGIEKGLNGADGHGPLWRSSLRTLLSTHGDARAVINMCTWSLRRDTVDGILKYSFIITDAVVHECPQGAVRRLRQLLAQLLLNALRAVQRQLCSGNEEFTHGVLLHCAFDIVRQTCIREILPALDSDILVGEVISSLISVVARTSVYPVVNGPEDLTRIISIVIPCLRAIPNWDISQQRVLSAVTATAEKYVPEVIAALQGVRVTSPDVGTRKQSVLNAWKQYDRALRAGDVRIEGLPLLREDSSPQASCMHRLSSGLLLQQEMPEVSRDNGTIANNSSLAESSSLEFRDRYKHILDCPEEYTENLITRLSQANLDVLRKDDMHVEDAFVDMRDFILTVHDRDSEDFRLHESVVNRLLEQGLLHHVINIKPNNNFWRHEHDALEFFKDLRVLEWLITSFTHLLMLALGGRISRSSEAFETIEVVLLREKERIIDFLRELWRRRHRLAGTKETRVSVQQELASVMVGYCYAFEGLYNVLGISIVPSFAEFGAFLIYYWAQARKHPESCGFVFRFVAERLYGDEDDNADEILWRRSLRILMSVADDARDVIDTCAWSVRRDIVDDSLSQVFIITDVLVHECPRKMLFEDLRRSSGRLLVNVLGAAHRLLCSGDEEIADAVIRKFAFSIIHVVCLPEMILSLDCDSKRSTVHSNLVLLAARCSVPAVIEGCDEETQILKAIIRYCEYIATEILEDLGQEILPAAVRTVERHVLEVSAALRGMSVTSLGIRARRNALLSAWKQYARTMGIDDRTGRVCALDDLPTTSFAYAKAAGKSTTATRDAKECEDWQAGHKDACRRCKSWHKAYKDWLGIAWQEYNASRSCQLYHHGYRSASTQHNMERERNGPDVDDDIPPDGVRPEFRERYAQFLDSPEQHIQDIVSCLSHADLDNLREDNGVLDYLLYLFPSMQRQDNILQSSILNTFIERGLFHHLLDITLGSVFWRYERNDSEFFMDVEIMAWLLMSMTSLLGFVESEDPRVGRSPAAFSSVTNRLIEEKDRVVHFFRGLWCHRHPIERILDAHKKGSLAPIILSYAIKLEGLYAELGTSLVPPFAEFGAFLLFYWSRSKEDQPIDLRFLILRMIRHSKRTVGREAESLWRASMRALMTSSNDAQAAIRVCADIIRKDVVDSPLIEAFRVAGDLLQECPQQIPPNLHPSLARLLFVSLRGAQRQLCSGDETLRDHILMLCMFSVIQYVPSHSTCTPSLLTKRSPLCDPETVLALDSHSQQSIVHSDLVSLAAVCSVPIVRHTFDQGPQYHTQLPAYDDTGRLISRLWTQFRLSFHRNSTKACSSHMCRVTGHARNIAGTTSTQERSVEGLGAICASTGSRRQSIRRHYPEDPVRCSFMEDMRL
ncbi:hypothetical protein NM688_g3591 [Phlebia brevispora]|uniref:Uncharacterized protein n=1 Tax=Phlebia brevispora TaxID=194682 RepID=A0ACC1T5A2_9APHY|nr:hypothetical protein NM688_g3591 [Phlebia brevispora]